MNRLMTYLRERFPLPVTSIHALATAALLVGVSSSAGYAGRLWVILLVAVTFFSFMLRMRVTDEFKDASHDSAHYPNRPVQRGAIFKRDLVKIGVAAFLLELTGVWFASILSGREFGWAWYLPVLIYSILTGREFFIGEFLERHFNLYFLIHQAIFVFWLLYAFQLFATPWSLPTAGRALAFFLLMISMEVVRKYEIRINGNGEVVRDTYLTVWGRGAFWVLLVNLVLSTVLLSTNLWGWVAGGVSSVALIAVSRKTDLVRAVAGVSFLLMSAVAVFA